MQIEKQTSEQYENRYALWRQKQDYIEQQGYKNVKVYQLDFKGLNEKFNAEMF